MEIELGLVVGPLFHWILRGDVPILNLIARISANSFYLVISNRRD